MRSVLVAVIMLVASAAFAHHDGLTQEDEDWLAYIQRDAECRWYAKNADWDPRLLLSFLTDGAERAYRERTMYSRCWTREFMGIPDQRRNRK
jgi:hypothetical protein